MIEAEVGELSRISIALATYNGGRYLAQQIMSLLDQDYPIHEVIICDDQSSDDTLDILNEYRSEQVKVYSNEKNIGYIKNFEKACRLCSGDYIALCDQDDIWEPNKLSTLVKEIEARKLSGIFSDARLIDQNGDLLEGTLWGCTTSKKLSPLIDRRSLYLANCVTGCTLLFKRELLEVALPFPNEFSHDWWLAFHAAAGYGLGAYSGSMIRYRLHGANTIGVRHENDKPVILRIFDEICRVIKGDRLKKLHGDNELMSRQFALLMKAEIEAGVEVSAELFALDSWISAKKRRNVIDYPKILDDSENPVFSLRPLNNRFRENYRKAFLRIGAPVYLLRALLITITIWICCRFV